MSDADARSTGDVELSIDRLSQLGEGTGLHQGRSVFVPGALPGERVRARVREEGKVLRGQLLEIRQPSPHRRSVDGELGGGCVGCDWLHADEALQQTAKQEIVLSALERLGHIERASLKVGFVPSPRALGYRRRSVLHFGPEGLGTFRPGTHDIVTGQHCPALLPELARMPPLLTQALRSIQKDIEEVTVLATEAPSLPTRLSLSVKLRGEHRPKHEEVALATQRALGLRGVVAVPKKGPPREVGKPVLWTPAPGRPEVSLFYRPDAFVQANAEANVQLVESTVRLCELSGAEHVIELYAGNGNFTLALAARAKHVIAVESAKTSSDLANRALREGKIGNVRFVLGDALKVTEGLVKESAPCDVLVLDPPRTGAPGIATLAKGLGAKRVVYVACDPAALARDARALVNEGYVPSELVIVDMFPQTHHVEAVLQLTRP